MDDILGLAKEIQDFCDLEGWKFAFIGGVANLAWGEVRSTRDVDLTLFPSFEGEGQYISAFLKRFEARIPNAAEFAMKNRVLLLSSKGIGVDVGLAGFQYELDAIDRAVPFDFGKGIRLKLICAEDLIAMKAFAGRDRDWDDIRGIVVRQGDKLDWKLIETNVRMLSEVAENPDMLTKLQSLRND